MLTIGKLSKLTGTKVPTIRYYESIGLLPGAERSSGNQRLYRDADRRRLAFVRHARELGFPLEAIRSLIDLGDRPSHSCDEADAVARRQLAAVNQRIDRLLALRQELERMLDHQARTGMVADCRVIEVLGDHAHCLGEHPHEI